MREPLLIADAATLTAKAEKDGKIRLTSSSWGNTKVIHADEVIELRWECNGVHLIRRPRAGPLSIELPRTRVCSRQIS